MIYFSVMVPVVIGFDVRQTHADVMLDTVSNCIFLTDIVLNFCTTFKEEGVWVRSRGAVAYSYATGWFPMDLLSSFPVDWVMGLVGGGSLGGFNKLLRILRITKLFRLLRLLKLFPKLFAIVETSVTIDPSGLRFMRSFVILLMTWHLMGCAYWCARRSGAGRAAQRSAA